MAKLVITAQVDDDDLARFLDLDPEVGQLDDVDDGGHRSTSTIRHRMPDRHCVITARPASKHEAHSSVTS